MITREDVLKKLLEAIDTYNSKPTTLTEYEEKKVKHIVAILEWVEKVCIREGFTDLLDDDYFTYCEGVQKDYEKITGTLPNIGHRENLNTWVQGTCSTPMYMYKPFQGGSFKDKEYVSLRRKYEMSYPLLEDDDYLYFIHEEL